jgi:hypothetical protein
VEARGTTQGERNRLICVIRPDDLRGVLQGAVRSDSIPKLRCERRHSVGGAVSGISVGVGFSSRRDIPYLCNLRLASKPTSSGEEKLRNKGEALKGHQECTRGVWAVIEDIMNAQLCTNLGNASGNGVMSGQ